MQRLLRLRHLHDCRHLGLIAMSALIRPGVAVGTLAGRLIHLKQMKGHIARSDARGESGKSLVVWCRSGQRPLFLLARAGNRHYHIVRQANLQEPGFG